MRFNSLQFLFFFPVVTALYFAWPHRHRWLLLLLASCIFYMAFVPAYIAVLMVTIGVDYALGLLIEREHGRRRKLYLWVSVVCNLLVLAAFKYLNFVNDNLRQLAELVHWNYPIEHLNILLPIGLSFHIFQSLSYVIEVYKGRQTAERHLGIYALYVMFFPQLVAGPIERPQRLLRQFREQQAFDAERVANGLKRMAWGFFKKVVIADRLALVVNPVFAQPTEYQGLPLILATFLFAIQIYCDFSGYTDIALGASEVLGFRLMENFRQPYFARSAREFWTRWHISLSTWFKDYVYIPLGGNRVPARRWAINIFVVFMLSGLWHGANWTFIVWGGLHGAYMVSERMIASWRLARFVPWLTLIPHHVAGALQVAGTFGLVTFAWIFFRANSLADAHYIVTHLFVGVGEQLGSLPSVFAALNVSAMQVAWMGLFLSILLVADWVQERNGMRRLFQLAPGWVRLSAYNVAMLALLIFGVYGDNDFIYFQF